MCNAYGQKAPVARLIDTFRQDDIEIRFDGGAIPNLEPRDLIRPTDLAPVLRPVDPADPAKGLTFSEIRWWLVPGFHKGPLKQWTALCTNARAETIDITPAYREPFARRRCLVPATHFFEWTARPTGGKSRLRIAPANPADDLSFFAGLWDTAHPADCAAPLDSFTLATCPAGPDMSAVHSRQPVILTAQAGLAWLDLDGPGKALLTPSPAGALTVAADDEPPKAPPAQLALF